MKVEESAQRETLKGKRKKKGNPLNACASYASKEQR